MEKVYSKEFPLKRGRDHILDVLELFIEDAKLAYTEDSECIWELKTSRDMVDDITVIPFPSETHELLVSLNIKGCRVFLNMSVDNEDLKNRKLIIDIESNDLNPANFNFHFDEISWNNVPVYLKSLDEVHLIDVEMLFVDIWDELHQEFWKDTDVPITDKETKIDQVEWALGY